MPAQSAAPMRWWGWGRDGRPPMLDRRALRAIAGEIGLGGASRPPVALDAVRLEAPTLSESAEAALRDLLGAQRLRADRNERIRHAAGRSYMDLVRLRSGELSLPDGAPGAPDAVAHPRSREELAALLAVCARHRIAVVPFGGGTSVVGGLTPLRGECDAVLCLDLDLICATGRLDGESMTLTAGAGLRVAAVERWLGSRGMTLGHFPQSFEQVSLGGCAATRSAGQASGGYGRFENMVLGLSLTAPAGRLALRAVPASAAGPDLRELVLGSEGTLGVIDELTLRVRRAPAARRYEGIFFGDFQSGLQTLRVLAQEGLTPAVARLADERETALSMAMASAGADGGGASALKDRLGRAYLGVRGYSRGCLAIIGYEGSSPERVRHAMRSARQIARHHEGLPVGHGPGEAWLAARFEAPYLRDELLTHGAMVETLETATVWSSVDELRRAVSAAIAAALAGCGTPGILGCHVSHVYETGASLYFTLLARRLIGDELRQWRAVKEAAGEAIAARGATISHHHAIGTDHAPWMVREVGAEGIATLRAVKAELDPTGIMNPGKLLAQRLSRT